jgi:cation diffusion facilitator family transporter
MKKVTHPPETAGSLSEETKTVRKIALCAFFLNVGIVGLKTALAGFSGSLSITASAVDSATDAIASLAVLGGLWISTRKSERFPYGLYKIENVISVFVAISIFCAGYEILRKATTSGGEPLVITPVILGGFFCTVLVTFLFGQYAIRVGKRTNSPTLMAEGRHRQVDVLSSVVVFLVVTLHYLGFHPRLFNLSMDYLAAACVVVFIVFAGWELLLDGMRVLLDASLDSETLDRVRDIIEAEPMVTQVKTLTGRNAGRFRFLETDIVIRSSDLRKADKMRLRLEKEICKRLPHIEQVVVRAIPQAREYQIVAVPVSDMVGNICPHFGEAPYFLLIHLKMVDADVMQRQLLVNPHTQVPKGKGIRVAEWLVQQKIDVIAVMEDLKNKGPSYVFADAGVSVERVQEKRLDALIDSFKLKGMT